MTAERLDVAHTVEPVDLDCEARRHDCDAPAEWIVWQFVCCPARPAYAFICTPCLECARTSPVPCRCPDCGHRSPSLRSVITRIERIDGRGPAR